MKIIELRAENIKRLVAVTIKPDGNLVEITGKNGQGKTSVLDAIWWALEGQKNIQSVPIRKGEASAKIRLDLGELKITRTFSQAKDKEKNPTGDYTTSIVVENAEGARFPSPQAVIDRLLGALSFDPLAFTRMKPAEQLETLKGFVPGVDFNAIDEANAKDFRTRTDLNRQSKEFRARETAIVLPGKAPEGPVDEAALTEKLESSGKRNAEIERMKTTRQAGFDEAQRITQAAYEKEQRIRKLADEILALKAEAKALREKAEAQDKALEGVEIPELIDTAEIREACLNARKQNRAFEEYETSKKAKARLADQADSTEKQAEALTQAMEARKKQKADAIAAAKLPIDGIGFGDGMVLLNGIPFDQASDAEQLRASINIAAAMNPKLRVIRVRDGSLLDDDAMKLLAEFADASDMQVWIERVDSTGKVGFVLEDGHVLETVNAGA